MLSAFQPLLPEDVSVLETLGQVLAGDVIADMDIPPLTDSAMDGCAVRAADTARASFEHPVRLRLIEDPPAGYTTDVAVILGTDIRI